VDDFGVHLKPLLNFFMDMPEVHLGPVMKDVVKWFKNHIVTYIISLVL